VTTPAAPQRRAVATASAISLGAPCAEATLPLRNRTPATTGAASGVESTASWAFKPFTFEYP